MSYRRSARKTALGAVALVVAGLLIIDESQEGAAEDPPRVDDDEVVHADVLPALGRPGFVRFHGRIVVEEKDDLACIDEATPWSCMSQDEVEDVAFEVRLGERRIPGRTDGEGRFDLAAEGLDLPAGDHDFQVGPPGGTEVWGRGRAVVLPEESPPLLVTSDIDQTYLVTDFRSTSAKAALLRQRASEKLPFPGSPELYRAIASGGRPIVFLSGSPDFFQRTLEARFRLDRVPLAGLHLKDMKGRARSLDLSSLKEQVGYKLEVLLAQRSALPAATKEVLLGDDTEADFVVYSLYRDFTDGTLETAEDLVARLAQLEVPERDRERIAARARALDAAHRSAPVQVAVIRKTNATNERFRLDDWVETDLVAADDSFQMALVLLDRGILSADDASGVLSAMVQGGQDAEALRRAATAAAGRGAFRMETLESVPRR